MKNNIKKSLSYILCAVLFAALTLGTGCGKEKVLTSVDAKQTIESQTLGEGETSFTLDVADKDGNSWEFTINTNEDTVGAALLNLGLISGDESEWGLYVKTVNGITADYDTDGTYWAFYINGEYAQTGVDSTPVEAGATYSLNVE